jgi:hypothetical protein
VNADIGSSEVTISDSHREPHSGDEGGDFVEIDYPIIFNPSQFDRFRATRDRDGLLTQLDGVGHGIFAARIAERHLWYGHGKAARALAEAHDHPLPLSVRARASYLLGDVVTALAITDRLLASARTISPLHLEARLLAHETCGLYHQYVNGEPVKALISYAEALSLARVLGMVHTSEALRLRMSELQRGLNGGGSQVVTRDTIGERAPDPLPEGSGSPIEPALDRLHQAIDTYRSGEVFLAGHALGGPPGVDTGRDEAAWWSCLALQILATTRDAAVARPRFAFEVLGQLRARRVAYAMERSNSTLVERLAGSFPLGFALAVSHPDMADWRYATRFLPVVRLEPQAGIFVGRSRVVTLNWRVRDDLLAQIAQGFTLLAAMRAGGRPGRDREWRRLLRERLPKAGLEPEQLCSVREYCRGLAELRRAMPDVAFVDVVTPLLPD